MRKKHGMRPHEVRALENEQKKIQMQSPDRNAPATTTSAPSKPHKSGNKK